MSHLISTANDTYQHSKIYKTRLLSQWC